MKTCYLKRGRSRGVDVVWQQRALSRLSEALGSIPRVTQSGMVSQCHSSCLKRQGFLGIVHTFVILTWDGWSQRTGQFKASLGYIKGRGGCGGNWGKETEKEKEKAIIQMPGFHQPNSAPSEQSCIGKPSPWEITGETEKWDFPWGKLSKAHTGL